MKGSDPKGTLQPASAIDAIVREIIRKVYFKGRRPTSLVLLDEDSLLGKLGLDSIEIMQIIVDIESRLGIPIDDDQLRLEHFETVGTLARWVSSLQERQ